MVEKCNGVIKAALRQQYFTVEQLDRGIIRTLFQNFSNRFFSFVDILILKMEACNGMLNPEIIRLNRQCFLVGGQGFVLTIVGIIKCGQYQIRLYTFGFNLNGLEISLFGLFIFSKAGKKVTLQDV